jgi:hypothetical protein
VFLAQGAAGHIDQGPQGCGHRVTRLRIAGLPRLSGGKIASLLRRDLVQCLRILLWVSHNLQNPYTLYKDFARKPIACQFWASALSTFAPPTSHTRRSIVLLTKEVRFSSVGFRVTSELWAVDTLLELAGYDLHLSSARLEGINNTTSLVLIPTEPAGPATGPSLTGLRRISITGPHGDPLDLAYATR